MISQDSFSNGRDEVMVPNGAGGLGCVGVTPLTLITLLNPGLYSLFIARPVKASFDITQCLLYTKVSQGIMHLSKHNIPETGRDDQLCVRQLSASFLKFTTNNTVLDKTLLKTWRAPTWTSSFLNMLS